MTYDPNLQLSPHFRLGEFISANDPDGVSWFNSSPVTFTARLSRLCHVLEKVRDHFGAPITINSGLRSPAHNAAVGGAPKSQHVDGEAADFTVGSVYPPDVAAYCESLLDFGGVGTYETWTHADVRDRGPDGVQARWNG